MADNKKISDLDDVPIVDGSEYIPILKTGFNFKMSVAAIRNWIGVVSSVRDGLMSTADKIKLSNIAEGATLNSTDIVLKARANHTGTQSTDTITGLSTVATSNQYSDLTGKPDLSESGLGFAPASHVGSGGTTAHQLATDTLAGFMPPELYQAILSVKQVAFTADYNDLINIPANGGGGGGSQKGGHRGFSWFADSNQLRGSSLNDHNSFGTGSYVGVQPTGTTFRSASEHHSFVSDADTYTVAGIRSAKPMFKRAANTFGGGVVFEAIVGWDYVAGSTMFIGLTPTVDKAYQNWSNGDKGISVGWDATHAGTAKLKIFSADGDTYTVTDVDSDTINTNGTYYISIIMKPNMNAAYVTIVNLDTGVYLANSKAITATLPPSGAPMYCITQCGTMAGSASTTIRIHAISALLTGVGDITVAPEDTTAILSSLSTMTTRIASLETDAFTATKMTNTAWLPFTLQNGWTVYTGRRAVYRKVLGMVFFEVSITGGTYADGTAVFTFPSGYTPSATTSIIAVTRGAGWTSGVLPSRIDIATSGVVSIANVTSGVVNVAGYFMQ